MHAGALTSPASASAAISSAGCDAMVEVEVVAKSAVDACCDCARGIECAWDTESRSRERTPPAYAELGVA
jgi:hypothetical protein